MKLLSAAKLQSNVFSLTGKQHQFGNLKWLIGFLFDSCHQLKLIQLMSINFYNEILVNFLSSWHVIFAKCSSQFLADGIQQGISSSSRSMKHFTKQGPETHQNLQCQFGLLREQWVHSSSDERIQIISSVGEPFCCGDEKLRGPHSCSVVL